MVNTLHLYRTRPAVAMIELIFALVVMGIVLMSAPAFISTANKSSYISIQQESINEAATQLNIILTYPWDDRNFQQLNDGYASAILTVTDGNVLLDVADHYRAGTPPGNSRSDLSGEFIAGALPAATPIAFHNPLQSISSFNGMNITLNELEDAQRSDYIERNIAMNIAVDYRQDSLGSFNQNNINIPNFNTLTVPIQTSNIKYITVTLTSTSGFEELTRSVTLNAFSCNIGSHKIGERL